MHNNAFTFGVYLYSACTQHGTWHQSSCDQWAGWPISFCGPTQERASATDNTGKTRERLWENEGEWIGKVGFRNEQIASSRRSFHGYIFLTTPGFKLKGEPLSYGFSTYGSSISASAAPYCGGAVIEIWPKHHKNVNEIWLKQTFLHKCNWSLMEI